MTVVACGPSATDAERSYREFRLAASLRDEGDRAGAMTHLRKALDLDPNNGRAHILLGYVHLDAQELTAAVAQFNKGLSLLEGRDDLSAVMAETRNMLGVAHLRMGQYEHSVRWFSQSAKDPMNTAPWYAWGNLGQAYFEWGKWKRAKAALRKSVEIQPQFCLGHYWLGRVEKQRGNLQEAESALDMAVGAHPKCGEVFQEAWRLRGEVRAKLGRYDDSVADFERCVEMAPKTAEGRACARILKGKRP